MMGPITVAMIAAAVLQGATLDANMPATGPSAPTAGSANTIRVSETPLRGQVSSITVTPATGGADIVIAVDAGVGLTHFTLEGPHRVVVDLGGAELALRVRQYDGVARGPIRNIRLSQYRTDTVRLVIDLDNAHTYKVDRQGNEIRLAVNAPATQFARWELRSTNTPAQTTVATTPAPRKQEAAGRLEDVLPTAKADVTPPAVTKPEPAKSEPTKPETAKSEPTKSEHAKSEPAKTAPVKQQPTVPPTVTSQAVMPPTVTPQTVMQETVKPVASTPAKVEPKAEPVRDQFAASLTGARDGFRDVPQSVVVPTRDANTPAPRRQQAQQPKPRITVNFDGTDIRDVIATFAVFSGRTIVIGKDVSGTVTADIADKPWDVALQAILQSQGLSATEDASGILTVDSYRNLASNQSLEPLVTQILDVNYAKATTLQQTVQKLLARDCTGMSTMATGRELGMNTSQQGGQSGANNQGMQGQGCVVRGSVAADSATNKLIITEVPSRLPEIIARLQELDIRTQQVAIKAKIVFINNTGITEIGLAYDIGQGTKQFFQQLVPRIDPSTLVPVDTDGDGVPDARGGGTTFQGPARIALGGNAISGIANANNAIKPNALNLIYSAALGKYQLTAFLNALTTSSLAEVQSEPSVTILNNRTATIFVGQEIPIRVIDASAGGQGGGSGGGSGGGGQSQPNAAAFFPRATVSKEEAGIKLTVTPQITNNRMVLLDIIAENSSAELANTDIGVVFNRQKAQSQVLVADGESAVIGGLTVTEKNKFRSGIPILMNLPFIGRLFSQNSSTVTKRDLLILVTPHILDDGAAPPGR